MRASPSVRPHAIEPLSQRCVLPIHGHVARIGLKFKVGHDYYIGDVLK
jgi:hypothetical protein